MMPRKSLLLLLVLLAFVLPLAGCLYSREISRTKRDIERQYPEARFEREIVLSLGPMSLGALGFLAGLVPADEPQMARAYLREISRVKVGVYRVEALPDFDRLELPARSHFKRDGWEVALKALEDDGAVWVLYKERYREVRDLYFVVLSDEELVLARVQGHLDSLLARVLEDHRPLRDLVDVDN